jgi:hypothetical protein
MGAGRALLYLYTVWTITRTARQPTHARIGEESHSPRLRAKAGSGSILSQAGSV